MRVSDQHLPHHVRSCHHLLCTRSEPHKSHVYMYMPMAQGPEQRKRCAGLEGGVTEEVGGHCAAEVGRWHVSERLLLVPRVPSLPPFPVGRPHLVGSAGHGGQQKKQCNWWCAACAGQDNWKDRNGVLVIQDTADLSEAKESRAMLHQGFCENFFCAMKSLATVQNEEDSFV